MNEATKLWAMLIAGPDDVYAMASEEAARVAAAEHDRAALAIGLAERFGLTSEDVQAKVIEWPHSAERHAECLASGEPDVMDTTNGNGIPDSLFHALQDSLNTEQ